MRSIELHNEIFLIRSPFLQDCWLSSSENYAFRKLVFRKLEELWKGKETHLLPTWKKTQNIFYLPICLPTCCHEKRGVWQWDLLQQSWSFHGGCPDVSSWSTAIDSSSHISATLQQQCTIKSLISQSFPLEILHNSGSAESPSRIFFLLYVQEEICKEQQNLECEWDQIGGPKEIAFRISKFVPAFLPTLRQCPVPLISTYNRSFSSSSAVQAPFRTSSTSGFDSLVIIPNPLCCIMKIKCTLYKVQIEQMRKT